MCYFPTAIIRAYVLIIIEDLTAEWVGCDLAAFQLRALELLRHMRWDMRSGGCGGYCMCGGRRDHCRAACPEAE